MKLKILKNVVVGRKIETAGAIVDVPDRKTVTALIDGKFATDEVAEPAPQQQQQQQQQPPPAGQTGGAPPPPK